MFSVLGKCILNGFGRSGDGASHTSKELRWYQNEARRLETEFGLVKYESEELKSKRRSALNEHRQKVEKCTKMIKYFRDSKRHNYQMMTKSFDKSTSAYDQGDFSTANEASKSGKKFRKMMQSDRRSELFWLEELKNTENSFVDAFEAEIAEQDRLLIALQHEITETKMSIQELTESLKKRQLNPAANF